MTTTDTALCSKIIPTSHRGYAAPCVLVAGHGHGCIPDALTRHYGPGRLADKDAAWLRSEVAMLHEQIESEKRNHRRYMETTDRAHRRLIGRLVALAPANGKRKTVLAADVLAAWQAAVNGS